MSSRPHPAARSRRAVVVASIGAVTVLGATMAVDGLINRSDPAPSTTRSGSNTAADRSTPSTTITRRSATPSTTVPKSSSRSRTRAS